MSQVLEIKFTTSPVHGGDCGRSKPGAGGDLNWTRIVTGNNPVTQSGEVTTCRSCGQSSLSPRWPELPSSCKGCWLLVWQRPWRVVKVNWQLNDITSTP